MEIVTESGELVTTASSMNPDEAVIRAVDGDTLLEGEDPDTPHIEDADHWISVYRELIAFKRSLLDSTNEDAAQLDHREARQEATHVDGAILRAELERFRRRLQFWQERRVELEGRSGL